MMWSYDMVVAYYIRCKFVRVDIERDGLYYRAVVVIMHSNEVQQEDP